MVTVNIVNSNIREDSDTTAIPHQYRQYFKQIENAIIKDELIRKYKTDV